MVKRIISHLIHLLSSSVATFNDSFFAKKKNVPGLTETAHFHSLLCPTRTILLYHMGHLASTFCIGICDFDSSVSIYLKETYPAFHVCGILTVMSPAVRLALSLCLSILSSSLSLCLPRSLFTKQGSEGARKPQNMNH